MYTLKNFLKLERFWATLHFKNKPNSWIINYTNYMCLNVFILPQLSSSRWYFASYEFSTPKYIQFFAVDIMNMSKRHRNMNTKLLELIEVKDFFCHRFFFAVNMRVLWGIFERLYSRFSGGNVSNITANYRTLHELDERIH